MLRTCCCCLSLQVGCYMVAAFFLLVQIIRIYSFASLLPYLGPDEREDKENEEGRERIKTKNIVWIVFTVLFCFIGLGILVAAYWKRPTALKVLAIILLVPNIAMIIQLPFEGKPLRVKTFLSMIIPFGISIYCSVILWSFAKEIENSDELLAVYTDPSYIEYQQGMEDPDHQYSSYPSQQQLDNRDRANNSPYPPPYGYGNWPGSSYRYYQPQPNYYFGHNSPYPSQPRQ